VIAGVVLTFVDITRLRRFRESEARLERALVQSRVSVWEQAPDGTFRWAFGRVFGRSAEDVVGRSESDLMSEPTATILARSRQAALDHRTTVSETITVAGSDLVTKIEVVVAPTGRGDELDGTSAVAIWTSQASLESE